MEKNLGFIYSSEALLTALAAKATSLNDLDIISSTDLATLSASFQDFCIAQLRDRLERKLKSSDIGSRKDGSLAISVVIDALASLNVHGSRVVELKEAADTYITKVNKGKPELVNIARRLETFIGSYVSKVGDQGFVPKLDGLHTTVDDRQSIQKSMAKLTTGMDGAEKFKLLSSILGDDWESMNQLDKLLAARHIISSCDSKSIFPFNWAKLN